MADEDEGHALVGQSPDDGEEMLYLAVGQCGRWLIHDQKTRLMNECAGDGDELLLRYRELRDRKIEVEGDADLIERAFRHHSPFGAGHEASTPM